MVTEADVADALRLVISLKAGGNIVDLGMVKEIEIKAREVYVKMVPSDLCPFSSYMAVKAEGEILKIEGVKKAHVELVL
ncbi:MAG: iron-sulfur cluster assembly protein [Candidatus Hydrothermarchaeales archaeon]